APLVRPPGQHSCQQALPQVRLVRYERAVPAPGRKFVDKLSREDDDPSAGPQQVRHVSLDAEEDRTIASDNGTATTKRGVVVLDMLEDSGREYDSPRVGAEF